MSESEIANLFIGHVDSFVTILFGYFSITSAFLVASYLAARTIPTLLAYVMVSLYSTVALALIGYAQRHGVVAVALRNELKQLGVDWHTAATEPSYRMNRVDSVATHDRPIYWSRRQLRVGHLTMRWRRLGKVMPLKANFGASPLRLRR